MPIIRLVILLALSSSAFARPLPGATDNNGYTACDVHFYGMAKDVDAATARAKLSQATSKKERARAANAIQTGRDQATHRTFCRFHQGGYTYDDALALASYWNTTPAEAKALTETKISAGLEQHFRDHQLAPALKQAQHEHIEGGHEPVDPSGTSNLQAFRAAGYRYCHAKMMAGTSFGADADAAKSGMGKALRLRNASDVKSALDTQRQVYKRASQKPCQFHETGYSLAEAQKLASVWGESLSDAKGRVEDKFAWGNEQAIEVALGRSPLP